MIRDIWTVMWREWRELAVWREPWVAFSSLVSFVGLFGVFLPWQVGPAWISAPWLVLFWAWLPLFLVTTVIADSFAGERERRTLETLLATRLPGPAILLGKIGAAVVWVWGAAMLCVPVGLVTVNLTHPSAGPILYPPAGVIGIAAVAVLAALLGACLGVLVSLRAGSVRQAQQTLTIVVLALLLVPAFGLRALPDAWLGEILALFLSGDAVSVAFAFGAAFLAADAVLLMLALARYRRGRLLLD